MLLILLAVFSRIVGAHIRLNEEPIIHEFTHEKSVRTENSASVVNIAASLPDTSIITHEDVHAEEPRPSIYLVSQPTNVNYVKSSANSEVKLDKKNVDNVDDTTVRTSTSGKIQSTKTPKTPQLKKTTKRLTQMPMHKKPTKRSTQKLAHEKTTKRPALKKTKTTSHPAKTKLAKPKYVKIKDRGEAKVKIRGRLRVRRHVKVNVNVNVNMEAEGRPHMHPHRRYTTRRYTTRRYTTRRYTTRRYTTRRYTTRRRPATRRPTTDDMTGIAASTPKLIYDAWLKFGGCEYMVKRYAKNYDDAEWTCRRHGAHLVSIHSEAENNFIHKITSDGNRVNSFEEFVYIGLRANSRNEWHWVDGSPLNYEKWAEHQPDHPGSENCGQFHQGPAKLSYVQDYHWNSLACERPMKYYVCKKCKISHHHPFHRSRCCCCCSHHSCSSCSHHSCKDRYSGNHDRPPKHGSKSRYSGNYDRRPKHGGQQLAVFPGQAE